MDCAVVHAIEKNEIPSNVSWFSIYQFACQGSQTILLRKISCFAWRHVLRTRR